MEKQPIEDNQKYCSKCGEVIFKEAEICPKCGVRQMSAPSIVQAKSRTTAGLLALFLGGLGIHKFYVGKSGWMYLLFCWTLIPSFVALVDAIKLFNMTDSEFFQKYA